MRRSDKVKELINEILDRNFIIEDHYSCDICTYCGMRYGNYLKFRHSYKTVQENHNENCIYRLAHELREMYE